MSTCTVRPRRCCRGFELSTIYCNTTASAWSHDASWHCKCHLAARRWLVWLPLEPLSCTFLRSPSGQRQAVIGCLQSVITKVIEYKQMSFSHDQKSKCTSANSRLKSEFHSVAVCLFTLVQCLFTVCAARSHICLCIGGQLSKDVQWRTGLSSCSGSPMKTTFGSSMCCTLSCRFKRGNCARNDGN